MLKGTNSLEKDRFWPLATQTLDEGPSRHGGVLPAQVDPQKVSLDVVQETSSARWAFEPVLYMKIFP